MLPWCRERADNYSVLGGGCASRGTARGAEYVWSKRSPAELTARRRDCAPGRGGCQPLGSLQGACTACSGGVAVAHVENQREPQNYLEGWAAYEDEVDTNRNWASLLRGFYSCHGLLGRLGCVSIIDIRRSPASSRLRTILTVSKVIVGRSPPTV